MQLERFSRIAIICEAAGSCNKSFSVTGGAETNTLGLHMRDRRPRDHSLGRQPGEISSGAMWDAFSHSQSVRDVPRDDNAPGSQAVRYPPGSSLREVLPSQNSQATQMQKKRERHSREMREHHNARHNEYKQRRRRDPSHSRSRSRERERSPVCDRDGHLRVRLGNDLTERYKILDELGEGTFGKVLECWDRKYKRRIAVKVVRDVERYREGAEAEIEILRRIENHADMERGWGHCCVRLLNDFMYHGHVCMAFDLYGPSLYEVIKKNKYQGFNRQMVQDIALQLFSCVAWLHAMRLVHTDLKPENVLFRSRTLRRVQNMDLPDSNEIVLIDFGSATFEDEHHTKIVSTRHYRAPEVIMGTGWSYECDVWSLGCILCELLSGDALFQTHDNLEHLALMQKIIGPFPDMLVDTAIRGKKYFQGRTLLFPVNARSRESIDVVKDAKTLEEQFGPKRSERRSGRNSSSNSSNRREEHLDAFSANFLDLVQKCLLYDKAKRPSARQCLDHPFFTQGIRSGKYDKLLPPDLRYNERRKQQHSNDKATWKPRGSERESSMSEYV